MTEHQHTDDPRLDGTYLRVVPETESGGTVVLVGVTHDHPASRVRARQVVENVAPAVVALELPPLAMPLYRQYAGSGNGHAEGESNGHAEGESNGHAGEEGDAEAGGEGGDTSGEYDDGAGGEGDGGAGSEYDGGEMAAALAASGDARVVGIDAPNWAYGRRLVEALRSREPNREATVSAIRDTLSVTRYAISCAVGAAIRAVTPWSPTVETPATHDSSLVDPPAAQAADEARHLSRSRALLGALELPPGQELVDDLRERSMASRLESLRTEGAVVAVVGHAHLEPIHDRLEND